MADHEVVAMTPVPGVLVLALLLFFIALPALGAWHRRSRSRIASQLASELAEFASSVRREARCLVPDPALRARLARLRLAEAASLELVLEIGHSDAALLADTVDRLALRLRRRVAFERKMLARTASGLRRGAIAASAPPVVVLASFAGGIPIPASALYMLVMAEAVGCVLLWRLARVEI
jgi:Flp pilus assembly protein TadB